VESTKTPNQQFSPAEIEMIQRAALAVWNEVAYDALTATAEEKNVSVDNVTISRDEVLELALDAGRPEQIMRRDPLFTPDFKTRWEATSYEQMKDIVRPVFTYKRYGT